MFNLFLKECKEISKSLIYIIFVVISVAFFASEYAFKLDGKLEKPINVGDPKTYYEENGSYPYSSTNDVFSETRAPEVFKDLVFDYERNKYNTLIFGISKKKSLNDENKKKVEELLTKTSGKSITEIDNILESNDKKLNEEINKNIRDNFEEFNEGLKDINTILGGHSMYSKENLDLLHGDFKPLTYEEGLEEYNSMVYDDGVLGAYARPFAYLMTIVPGIMSVALVVFFTIKDKKSGMYELIDSKGISSVCLIIVRYLALISMILLPILILAIYSTIKLSSMAKIINPNYDYLAFIKCTLTLIGPTVLFLTSLAMFVTIFTETQVGILLPVIVLIQFSSLPKNYFGMDSIIVRNNIIRAKAYLTTSDSNLLLANRSFYTLLGVVFLILSIVVFSMKRSGKLSVRFKVPKVFSNMFNKPKNIMAK